MKIVLTNDDGYGEPGLITLRRSVQFMGEVVVVAPRAPQSGIGHRVTLRYPLQVDQVRTNHYIVQGTPADCTRLALKQFAPDADWVLAGINPGANLGSDVYQSGTVAAAREAAILGVKAIAISQYIGPAHELDWETTGLHAATILPLVMGQAQPPGRYWNINLPSPLDDQAPMAHAQCPLDKYPHRYSYTREAGVFRYNGVIHDRPHAAGSDVAVCFGGRIAITPLEV
ncbi:MAG: 5'/3'-nucleotidase SurE [Desulfatitalea sp.]|nr:5'/3'-nucleotidase SurE [Desulfatitalea sp.]NNJ99165.1 5'/3'-nucleotidase SurE [Desulfatitalea sp.]